MPCNSEYMEPSYTEVCSKEVCGHLVHVLEKLKKPIPVKVRSASKNYYGDTDLLVPATKRLKSEIKAMTHKQIESIIFDAHSEKARALATWYERELKKDLEVKVKADAVKKKAVVIDKALSKLRKEEVEILNNYIDWSKLKRGG